MCLFKSFVQLKKIGWFLLNFQEFCINISGVCATNISFKLVIYWFTVSKLFWLGDIFKFAEVELISFILVGSCPVLEIYIFWTLNFWVWSEMRSPFIFSPLHRYLLLQQYLLKVLSSPHWMDVVLWTKVYWQCMWQSASVFPILFHSFISPYAKTNLSCSRI